MRKSSRKKILIINGPNLNLLGRRQPEIYGREKLSDLKTILQKEAERTNLDIVFFQSNHEGAIVDRINSAVDRFALIIINPAAYTHTSVAIRDALLAVNIPAIEVHLSNIHRREDFRKKSLISDICIGVISGFGLQGYILALYAARKILNGK